MEPDISSAGTGHQLLKVWALTVFWFFLFFLTKWYDWKIPCFSFKGILKSRSGTSKCADTAIYLFFFKIPLAHTKVELDFRIKVSINSHPWFQGEKVSTNYRHEVFLCPPEHLSFCYSKYWVEPQCLLMFSVCSGRGSSETGRELMLLPCGSRGTVDPVLFQFCNYLLLSLVCVW